MTTQDDINEAIKACDELQDSDVYGDEVKRVLRNTKEELIKMGRPRKNPVKLDSQGREYFEAIVTAQGSTGRLYPPKDWIGHNVMCIRLN